MGALLIRAVLFGVCIRTSDLRKLPCTCMYVCMDVYKYIQIYMYVYIILPGLGWCPIPSHDQRGVGLKYEPRRQTI